jgi:hypothetical protein
LRETEKMLEMLDGPDLRDAGLIASAQKLENYEIAAYGTAAAFAGQLDLRDDQRMLHERLRPPRRSSTVERSRCAHRSPGSDQMGRCDKGRQIDGMRACERPFLLRRERHGSIQRIWNRRDWRKKFRAQN